MYTHTPAANESLGTYLLYEDIVLYHGASPLEAIPGRTRRMWTYRQIFQFEKPLSKHSCD